MLKTLVVVLALGVTGCAAGPNLHYRYFDKTPSGYHVGLDMMTRPGQPVYAIAAGRVIGVQPLEQPPLSPGISIEHANGLVSYYYHIGNLRVREGQTVAQGEQIATAELVGQSQFPDRRTITIPHLHLEISRDGRRLDPERVINMQCPTKEKPQVEWRWPVGC
jgi:murein DD-endopeptidase MepM/ murein hydrolase activator NlpD